MVKEVNQLQGFNLSDHGVPEAIHIVTIIISVLLMLTILIMIMLMKNNNKRMGWFLACVLAVMGGLIFEFMSGRNLVQNIFGSSDNCMLWAHIFYAAVAPVFTMYFIETERDEGQEWDGQFWLSMQVLMAVLAISFILFANDSFLRWLAFLLEYVIIIIMLLISSKNIRASAGFMIGCLFPVAVSFIGMMDVRINITGIGMSLFLLVIMFLYQIDVERELFQREAALSESKVALMMDQIHPHFIYNSLQQIALLCDEDVKEVKPAILNFSGYLRKNLESLTSVEMIPFLEEMKHVDMFVELSVITQSRSFKVVKELDVTDFNIPALTLQPLVENAIKYGIGMSTEGDSIAISTKCEKGYYIITVSDDGHGKRTELPTQKEHKSVGIKNVRTRLKLMCDGELVIRQTGHGTVQIIKIPIIGDKFIDEP